MKRNHPSPPQNHRLHTVVCVQVKSVSQVRAFPAELTSEDWNPHPGQSYSAATKVSLHPHLFTPELTTHLPCQKEKPNSKQLKMYGGRERRRREENQEAGVSHTVSSRGSRAKSKTAAAGI